MPSASMIAKMVFLLVGLHVSGYQAGVGAYYHAVDLRDVCRYRVERNWNPGLDCEWDCLAAWGKHEPDMLGVFVLADLPGGGFRL